VNSALPEFIPRDPNRFGILLRVPCQVYGAALSRSMNNQWVLQERCVDSGHLGATRQKKTEQMRSNRRQKCGRSAQRISQILRKFIMRDCRRADLFKSI